MNVVHGKPPHYVRQWRNYRDLSQERLGARVGRTQGAISQLETFQTEYTQGLLEALAEALGCTPADLIMRNPLDTEAPWTIWETLKPAERDQFVEIIKTFRKAS